MDGSEYIEIDGFDSEDDFLMDFLEDDFVDKLTNYVAADIWVMIVFYFIILTSGIIMNSLVIVVFLTTLKKTIFTNPAALYVVNMAFADILLLLHLPLTISKLHSGVFRFNSFACHTDKAIKNVHLFVTLVMIILMAFDRYIVMEDKIFLRFMKRCRKTPWVIKLACCCAWIFSFLAVIPMLQKTKFDADNKTCRLSWEESGTHCTPINPVNVTYWGNYSTQSDTPFNVCSCRTFNHYKNYMTFMILFGFLLPISGLIFCYCMVAGKILQSYNIMSKHSKSNRSGPRTIKMIGGLVISLMICYTPLEVYHLLRVLDIELPAHSCKNFLFVSEALIWSLPAINPIFYSFFARDFQSRLKLTSILVRNSAQRMNSKVRRLTSRSPNEVESVAKLQVPEKTLLHLHNSGSNLTQMSSVRPSSTEV